MGFKEYNLTMTDEKKSIEINYMQKFFSHQGYREKE